MTDTVITVRGEYSAWYPAERATVAASVQTEGPERESVFAGAVEASDALRNLIESIHDTQSGPVTRWSSDSVRVWSERPWNSEGVQLPLVYHSAVDFAVTFTDFPALGRWVESAAAIEGVTVGSIVWELTEATRTSATVEVRSRAVKDAVAKASLYAQSIGLATVSAIALADPGMLGDLPGGGAPSPVFARSTARGLYDSAGAPQLALKPEQIAVESVVDARFIAT